MDMDAFFASVEIRDDPSLKGKPLIIGALPTERGIVATCSYEARAYGVHSGMSIKDAYRLCPMGIYRHGRYDRYRQVSDRIHGILTDYTDQIEYVGLDEGYLDITGSLKLFKSADRIGHEIKKRVLDTTGLTCSIGISYNKMTAKMASEEKKPDGFFVIPDPEFFQKYMKDKPVKALPGVGAKGAAVLHGIRIDTIGQLSAWSEESLVKRFGQAGSELYRHARGIASDHVERLGEGKAKSYGKEVTYQHDMTDPAEMDSTLKLLARQVAIGLQKREVYAYTITLKIKYSNLKLHTRAVSLINPVQSASQLYKEAARLLKKSPLSGPVRLLGISASSLTEQPEFQLTISQADRSLREESLNKSLMGLYQRFGKDAVMTGGELESRTLLQEHGLND